jgi:single-strand DNA-binding protein
MAGVNKVILIGNLGKDPDVMTLDNGVKFANVRIATNENYKDREGNWVEQTEWHSVVLWRWLAEKNLVKGDTVYVEGKLKTRSWDDKDGNKRYTTEVVADKVLKISRSASEGGYGAPPPPPIPENFSDQSGANEESAGSGESAPSDDLPF